VSQWPKAVLFDFCFSPLCGPQAMSDLSPELDPARAYATQQDKKPPLSLMQRPLATN
jgi:hypothetical protein